MLGFVETFQPPTRVSLPVRFSVFRPSSPGRKAFVVNEQQRADRRRSQRGIWAGISGKRGANPRLGRSSLGGSFVLGSVSSPHRARRCAEDGHGRGGGPGPKRLSSESNLRVRRSGEWFPSPVSGHRLHHAGQRGELWLCLWLRRRTHRRHIERSRSLFCLARWPALFFTRARTHTLVRTRAHTHKHKVRASTPPTLIGT